ncbi:Uncharacterised protein [Amycolatopsis camponoti]|uniref:Uncharacterized protein n=1 Tax=Amycolatopsis camponoti TaxID=2606593 RepID=A0A6I8M2V3_9PSEU|nr:hypothetical protein [Amycolatopsis camponoti]VVJ23042.1 Uncharacterised protein [Amycolatopsis camponoti]
MTGFRTFCHISEYGEAGYRHLHRMIASSSPLVLWAPSSALLSAPSCQVEPRQFVDLVRNGHVRVIAREEWLFSSAKRNDHPWEGAAWTPSVDDELMKFAEADRDREASERRVTVASPEPGMRWAKDHFEENGELVAKVTRVLKGRAPEKDIPIGVLETARRYENDPRKTVEHILRDVCNHGDAIALSGAEAPFFLSPRDSQFLRWIDSTTQAPSSAGRRQQHLDHAELAAQLLALLRTMEISGGATDLDRFMGSEGHEELTRWYASICRCVALERPKSLEGKVSRELNRALDGGRLHNTLRSWMSRKVEAPVFALGLATTIAGPFVDGPSMLSLAGVLLGAIPVGNGVLRRLGYVPAQYTGAQWPFLYSFGHEASAKRIRRLRRALDLAAEA